MSFGLSVTLRVYLHRQSNGSTSGSGHPRTAVTRLILPTAPPAVVHVLGFDVRLHTPNTGDRECKYRRSYAAATGLVASAPLAAPRGAATGLPVAGFACTAFLNGFIGFDARLACLTTAVELACGVVPVVPATTTAVVSTGWENDVSCVGAASA